MIVHTGGAIWLNPFATVLFKEEGLSPVSAITERRDMVLYEVPLSMSLLGFGMWTMLDTFHVLYYVVVWSSFKHDHWDARQRAHMCFRCLMFSLSGPSCIFCVSLLMDLFVLCVACLTVFLNCLVKQFAICMSVVVILLLNVKTVYGLPKNVRVVPVIPVYI